MMIFSLILVSFYAFSAPMGIQEEWSNVSDPLIINRNFETRFVMLPLQAQVKDEKKYWSGDYWPLNKGLINQRWNAKSALHPTLSKETLKTMTQNQLAQLSPSEKFDLLNGRYHFPLKKEVEGYSHYGAADWEGICHGWAPASMNHNEPYPKTLKNPDGIMVPFGSADIKALLSYYYAYPYQVANTYQLGRRCYNGRFRMNEDCKKDLNAGAFHIVLTNRIGLENKGLIADMNRYEQVWNHPLMKYQVKILSDSRGRRSSSAPGTARLVKVQTKVTYVDESPNFWEPLNGTSQHRLLSENFRYLLELNAYGQIIGGEWISGRRPDFLWLKARPNVFLENYKRLRELTND